MNSPLKLDKDEASLLRDFDRGELTSITNFKETKRELEKAAADFCPTKPLSPARSTSS